MTMVVGLALGQVGPRIIYVHVMVFLNLLLNNTDKRRRLMLLLLLSTAG
jgi:hypothetical protein